MGSADDTLLEPGRHDRADESRPQRRRREPLQVAFRYEPIPGRLTEVQVDLLFRHLERHRQEPGSHQDARPTAS
jgi:hypothetical protein